MHARIAALFLLTASTSWALTEENVNQQFAVSTGGKLVVDVDFGCVDVTVGSDTEVAVRVHRKIDYRDEAREKEFLAAAPVVITQEGATITVHSRRAKDRERWSWNGHVEMDADYTITVPKNFNADLGTRGGSISANGITGKIEADTSGGKLKFTKLTGPLEAHTSGGSIALDGCIGSQEVSTSGGSIDCQKGSGSLEARTSGGSIVVRDFTGDTEVKTSGGKLTLENINGAVTGKTAAGSITATFSNPVPGDVTLVTSAGSINISLPEKAAVSVEAKAGMGNVRTEIPMLTNHSSDSRLEGTLNGGGKSLILHTGIGSINIRAIGPTVVEQSPR